MTLKVIYVSTMRLSTKVVRDWYIDFLIEKGATVEYWDVVSMVFGDVREHGAMEAEFLRTPKTYREFEEMIRLPMNRGAYYVMLLAYDGRVADIYRLVSKYDAYTVFIAWGAMPIGGGRTGRAILKETFMHPVEFAKRAFYKGKATAYRKLRIVKPFHIAFVAGEVQLASSRYAKKAVPINLVDYDHYARARADPVRPVNGRFAVFLDINLPYQSDLKLVNLPTIDASKYFQSLNRFFGLVESRFRVKVVIAAHPKANYSVNPFQGREVYSGLTPQVVKDAEFVITHHSTSISYAVLNSKPLVFVYTNEMLRAYAFSAICFMRRLADFLGAPIFNIDDLSCIEEVQVSRVDAKRYEAFKFGYLTTKASELQATQDIFWDELCRAVEGEPIEAGIAAI